MTMPDIASQTAEQLAEDSEYKYGFITDIESEFAPKGVNEDVVRFISMKKITSDNYDKGREVGIKRCGDNFAQDDSEVKTISVSKVFDTIVTNL